MAGRKPKASHPQDTAEFNDASPRAQSVDILEVELGRVSVAIVGTMPYICNRMSEKVKGILLTGSERKNAAAKAMGRGLKHNPSEEFANSPYMLRPTDAEAGDAPTLLATLATAFKKSMMTAALDTAGIKKAQIGRLVRVEGERLPLYGVPHIFLSVTRSADMNRTPDVRTRAIIPQWATFVDVTFLRDYYTEKGMVNLLARAGLFSGVGDWRTEKGSGNYGSFRLAGPDDAELLTILATGGRAQQIAAMNEPKPYDDETESLLTWYHSEIGRRGLQKVG